MISTSRYQSGLVATLLLALTVQAFACTVPVFRYALDRWHPDRYGLLVSESWLESKAGKAFSEKLEEFAGVVQLVPGEVEAGKVALMQPAQGSPELWRGEANIEKLRPLFNSPVRKRIVQSLVNGHSAVWVVIQSGDAKADSEFEARLQKRLNYLKQVASIPEQDPFDPENKLGPGPEMRVDFEVLKIKRDDPNEQLLIKMIAGPIGDELIKGKEPFASPVFGRGRALRAFTATDLDDEGIDELSLFLLGACSCQVKAQNPGWDLLINADWSQELMKVAMALEEKAMTEDAGAKPELAKVKPEPEEFAKVEKLVKAAAAESASKEPEVVVFGKREMEPPKSQPEKMASREFPFRLMFLGAGVFLVAVFLVRRAL